MKDHSQPKDALNNNEIEGSASKNLKYLFDLQERESLCVNVKQAHFVRCCKPAKITYFFYHEGHSEVVFDLSKLCLTHFSTKVCRGGA